MTSGAPLDVVRRVFGRHVALHRLQNYPGILSLQGLAHAGVEQNDSELLNLAREHLLEFVRDDPDFPCNFLNYRCGGNGTAFLLWRGHLPEAAEAVRYYADELLEDAPRDPGGIFEHRREPGRGKIWIDVAFAVTPFLLFAGLALHDDACIEEACAQTLKMYDVFRDPANGLLHQAKNFIAPGHITQDHWSRGNGWALLALAELVHYLPDGPRRGRAVDYFRQHIDAVLAFQDELGLWHQEITRHDAFVETSGTGLMLYALGVGLEAGVLDAGLRDRFDRGLSAYLAFIEDDGSVHNTCEGCAAPGDGSIEAYLQKRPRFNDPHAFGPAILAFTQAANLGIDRIKSSPEASPWRIP